MRLVRRPNALSEQTGQNCPDSPLSLASLQVTAGPMLCRLQIWTEQEWEALADRDRPIESIHVAGLGWVGAVPLECLN